MAIRYLYKPDGTGSPSRPDGNAALWRYMDLPKLLSLLDRQALFFCRLDRFDDPFEGSLPRALQLSREQNPTCNLRADDSRLIVTRRRNTIINCWHLGEDESVAMWKLYAQGNQGVAIRSTVGRLANSLPPYEGVVEEYETDYVTPKVLHVTIGSVGYISFEAQSVANLDVFALPFYKRKSFQHEHELRAVCAATPLRGDPTEETSFPNGGDFVPINLAALIEAVYVAPQAPAWFADVVRAVLKSHGLTYDVCQSSLDRDPMF